MVQWAAISSSRGPRFSRTLHYDPSVLGGHKRLAHSFPEVQRPLHHYNTVIYEEEIVKDRGVCPNAVKGSQRVGQNIATEQEQESMGQEEVPHL